MTHECTQRSALELAALATPQVEVCTTLVLGHMFSFLSLCPPSLPRHPCPRVQQRQRARAVLQLHDEDDDGVPNACPTDPRPAAAAPLCGVPLPIKCYLAKNSLRTRFAQAADLIHAMHLGMLFSEITRASSSKEQPIVRSDTDTDMHKWAGEIRRCKS